MLPWIFKQICLALLLSIGYTIGKRNQPNILVIMADDLGWNDVSWHNSKIHSPNLEYLAHNNAALLNQAYVNRLCSITRSAFLAGYYPFRMGTQKKTFKWAQPSGAPLGFKFFPEVLQEAGYKTYLVGKWHLGYCKKEFLPTSRGFHHFRGIHGGMIDYYSHTTTSGMRTPHIGALDFWDEGKPRFGFNGSYATEIYTNDVKEYLEGHNREQPFFLFLAFQTPHAPLEVPYKYAEPCKQKDGSRRAYCAMVNAMDQSVGKVVETLKNLGYYEDTVIIFTTDNGGDHRYGGNNYPLRGGKGSLWEGGTRAVSFVHSPKYIRSQHTGIRNDLISVVDWYPTILSMAGLPYNCYGDGINQWQLIQTGHAQSTRNSLVYNIWPSGSAIRRGKFKLIVGNAGKMNGRRAPPDEGIEENTSIPSNGLFLFNLEEDPNETKNIVEDVSPVLVASMMGEVSELLYQMKPLVHEDIHENGDPALFNGTFACCWC